MRPPSLRAARWPALLLAGLSALPSTSYGQYRQPGQITAASRPAASGIAVEHAVASANTEPLTLESALAQALANHPDLRAGQAELNAAAALVRQAGALPNPELATLMEDTRRETRVTTVQLNQAIELGGKRDARVRAAQLAEQQAALDLTWRRVGVQARLCQAFHGLAIAQARSGLGSALLALAMRAQDIAERRVAAGKAAPIEVVKAKLAVSQAKATISSAQGEERAARQRLAQAMGMPAGLLAVPVDVDLDVDLASLPALSAWDDLPALVEGGHAVRRARLEVARLQALADEERARATPDLTLTAGVKRDEQLKLNQPVLGVALSLPLLDRRQGAYEAAVHKVARSEAELGAARASLLAQAIEALEELRAALAEAEALRSDILPGAQQALDVATKGYEQGKFSFLDVLDAQRTYIEARHQSLTSAEAAYRAEARLIELLGTPPAAWR